VFRDAFISSYFLIAGYPRNTFGNDMLANNAAWVGVDKTMYQACEAWTAARKKIILVTPTFRDTRSTPIGLDAATISALDKACEAHGLELIFKFHPYERNFDSIRAEHLHVMQCDSDLYPFMPLSSSLITD
jgi:CDP-glycerol glycerophosphotransferase (TagB/SpsB family)